MQQKAVRLKTENVGLSSLFSASMSWLLLFFVVVFSASSHIDRYIDRQTYRVVIAVVEEVVVIK